MYAVRLDSLDGSLHKVYSNRLLVILGKGAFAEALDETALPNSAVTNDNYLSAVIQLLHHCVSEAGRLLALKHFFNQVSVIGEDQNSRLFSCPIQRTRAHSCSDSTAARRRLSSKINALRRLFHQGDKQNGVRGGGFSELCK